MSMYRDVAPQSMKSLTSSEIVAYFEDERATAEDIAWFRDIMTNDAYKNPRSPISNYRWPAIKKEFAKKYFPEIAPVETPTKALSIEDRLSKLFGEDDAE